MSEEYLELIKIDFDNMENRDAIYSERIGIFTGDGKLSAHGKLSEFLMAQEKSYKPYIGWNGQIYPQWSVVIGKLK